MWILNECNLIFRLITPTVADNDFYGTIYYQWNSEYRESTVCAMKVAVFSKNHFGFRYLTTILYKHFIYIFSSRIQQGRGKLGIQW